MRPLALLRPEPGWSASAAASRSQGIEIVGHPLFEPEAVAWELPEGRFDALLVGSGAVFRHGGAALDGLADLPVHAVGEATAEAARAAGFAVGTVGEGGLQQVLDHEAGEHRTFLRLGGEERVPLAPHPGQSLVEVTVYRMRPRELAAEFVARLRGGRSIVALHSAAAARHFAAECDRHGIVRADHALLALGQRIAAAAGGGWAAIHIADRPEDAALLAKAAALCK